MLQQQVLKYGSIGLVLLSLVPALLLGHRKHHLRKAAAAQITQQVQVTDGDKALEFLQWPADLQAVRYEVELFSKVPQNIDSNKPVENAEYRNKHVYVNSLLLAKAVLDSYEGGQPMYFRVRSYDLDGNPSSPFTAPQLLQSHLKTVTRNAPVPRPTYEDGKGSTLLYPVYAYTGNPGASQYEVEVTNRYPENVDGVAPSKYRVFSEVTPLTDLYDKESRIGTYYWRVRGMDKDGKPIGQWSLPEKFTTEPSAKYNVAIFGDSISHGGGHMSFSPVDFAYSYAHYLDVPTINLSESGDTSEMMVDRFEKDVLPFHVKYLLIMGGTNSLRGGVSAESVISDLREIQQKARANGMTPILLTLAPVNPDNIQKAFDEPTASGWQQAFAAVNSWIRTQPHIDTAAPFERMGSVLPTSMALDGLHGDANMKEIMAGVINRGLGKLM